MSLIILIFQSLTIILSPLYVFRGRIFIPTTLLEIVLLVTVFLTFIDFWKTGHKFSKLRTKFDLLIVLFLLNAILETIMSPNLIGALGILKAYFIEPVVFYYCLAYQIRRTNYNFVIYSLIISAVGLSLLGIIQKVTGKYSFAPDELAQGRVVAVYNSANSLALFLGPVIFLSLGKFLNKGNKKYIFLLVTLMFTLIMIWTKSRGGLIAELGGMIIMGFGFLGLKGVEEKSILQKLIKYWWAIPIAFFIFVGVFYFEVFLDYHLISPLFDQPLITNDTLQIRYFTWEGTLNLLKAHPIFGAGLDGFKIVYGEYYKVSKDQEVFQYPHNIVLTFWSETGFLGLIIFGLIYVKGFSILLKNFLKDNSIFKLSLIVALCYWLIHGLVDVPYFKNDLSLEFWTIIALVETLDLKAFKKVDN